MSKKPNSVDTALGSSNGAVKTSTMNGNGAVSAARLPTAQVRLGGARRRRPGYIALLVVLVVGLAALGGWLYTSAGEKVPVVVAVGAVPAGHVIERKDLSTVPVAGEVTAVLGSNLDSLVGQVAAVDLLPNMLVQRSMVQAADTALSKGKVRVGALVAPGSYPGGGLSAGDAVRVLQVPPKGDKTGGGATVLADRAVVFSVSEDDQRGLLVTLTVSDAQSSTIAVASAAERIAVVKVPAT